MRLITWMAVALVGTAAAEAPTYKFMGQALVKAVTKPAAKPPKGGLQKSTSAAPREAAASKTPVVVVTKSNAEPVKPLPSKVNQCSQHQAQAQGVLILGPNRRSLVL